MLATRYWLIAFSTSRPACNQHIEHNKNNCKPKYRATIVPPSRRPSRRLGLGLDREIPGEPVLDHAMHARVAFRKHEVIGVREEMQLRRLASVAKELD